MKQALSISLAVLIFIFSCGFSLAVTYCTMNEELSVSLEDKKDCCCEDEDDGECCEYSQIKLGKIKDNYVPEDISKLPTIKILESPLVAIDLNTLSELQPESAAHYFNAKAPPPETVSRTVLFRTLLI